jgi:hypothetical protein
MKKKISQPERLLAGFRDHDFIAHQQISSALFAHLRFD